MIRRWSFKTGKDSQAQRERDSQAQRERDLQAQRERVIQEIRDALWEASKNKPNNDTKEHLQFVCKEDVEKIWTPWRIGQLSSELEWGKQDLQDRPLRFLKVLSTLVWIHWDKWEDFGKLFLKPDGRSDRDLPLSNTHFLQNERLQSSFEQDQYIFIPVTLKEDDEDNQDEIDYVSYSKNQRLPLFDSEEIGEGSSGKVTKEAIARKYFFWKVGHLNPEEQYVAVKRIVHSDSDPSRFMAEHKNLKAFKQCLDQNTNIMLSYAAFAHGSNFIIISPLADLDLHKFFTGSYPDFQARRRRFTPIALLKESLGLAAALNFLHDGLRMREGQKVACAHLDLKPENILVKWGAGGATDVGRWKIHDFGTSRIKEPSATNPKVSGLLPGEFRREFSFTRAGRAPGPFQAPEVQSSQERVVGRESDMWSFGCILAFVLAFVIGGPKHTSQLAKTLDEPVSEDTETDYFYTIDSTDKSKFIIKPKVAEWLKSLKMNDGDKTPWVNNTLNLIFSTLVVDAKSRPKASDALNRLDAICSEKTDNFDAICSWVPTVEDFRIEMNILPPISSLVPTQTPSTHSIRETSQPTDGHGSSPNSPVRPVTSPTTSGSGLSDPWSGSSNEIAETAVFMKLKPPRKTFTTTICPSGCHAAFVSKNLAKIHCLNWVRTRAKSITQPMIHAPDVREISCPDEGYEWNYVCLSDSYVLLRAKDQRSRNEHTKIHLYRYDMRDHTSSGEPEEVPLVASVQTAATNAVRMAVSSLGDILFMWDAALYFYSSNLGVQKLKIAGLLHSSGASFSPDGKRIYGWSFSENGVGNGRENYWYMWNATNAEQLSKVATARKTAEGSKGQDTLFPLSTYFSAFERPNRMYVIGKDETKFEAVRLSQAVRDIVAGASYRCSDTDNESLVLVSSNGMLTNLKLLPDVDASSPSFVGKLKNGVTTDDGIAVLELDSSIFVIVSHCNGYIEKRKIWSK